MARKARATIDLGAILGNYLLAKKVAANAKALAVVKADAYGHGSVEVSKVLNDHADGLGVATIEEAIELRDAGITAPINLLEGFFDRSELPLIDELNLGTVLHTEEQLEDFLAYPFQHAINTWAKFDTGMGRLGFAIDQLEHVYRRLKGAENVAELVLMTHFARADELDVDMTSKQMQQFMQLTKSMQAGLSMANSAGVLAWPQSHVDWVRPGIMLYGASPFEQDNSAAEPLRAAMTLRSEIIAIHDIPKGGTIGYGSRYTCPKDMRIAVVAMGYGDGYPRSASDGTPLAVDGVRTQLVGRVSMDMITIDCTDIPGARIGSPVELWGNQISVNEVAACSDTISYELLTRRTNRVPRDYLLSD